MSCSARSGLAMRFVVVYRASVWSWYTLSMNGVMKYKKMLLLALAVLVACGALTCLSGCGRARILHDPAAAAIALERSVAADQNQQPDDGRTQQNQADNQERPKDAPQAAESEPTEDEPLHGQRQTSQVRRSGEGQSVPRQQEASRPQQNNSKQSSEQKKTQKAGDAESKETRSDSAADAEGDTKKPDATSKRAAKSEDASGNSDKSGKNGANVNQDTEAKKDSENDQTKRSAEDDEANASEAMSLKLSSYTSYIDSKHQTVFPCQQTNVYCERVEDYQAAHKPSAENRALLAVEAVNVGELKTDTVSAAWITASNPGLIVKLVDDDILGKGVTSTSAARRVANDILARTGWEGVDAVQHRDVVVASASLLDSDAGAMLFKLYLAMYIYPDAYKDLIEQGGIDYVYEDMYGSEPDGTYFFSLNGLG